MVRVGDNYYMSSTTMLLFDVNGRPKPAFDVVIRLAAEAGSN